MGALRRHSCFLKPPRGYGECTGPDWLARAKGSLGWNDGLLFGLGPAKRQPAYFLHPTTNHAPRTAPSQTRLGRLQLEKTRAVLQAV